MSSFFGSNEQKPITQKSLTFNSSNGLEYVQNNRIVIEIPADSCAFFDPSSSYLKMNVQIRTNTPAKNYLLQLDTFLGAGILCRDIIIKNLQGVTLEELISVNTMLNVMEMYSDNINNQQKAGLTSGQVLHNPNQRTWHGNLSSIPKSRQTNSEFNPWFVKDATGNATYCVVPICLKLPTSIFSSKRIWANQMFSGLRIEILLEDASKCFKLLRNATPPSTSELPIALPNVNDAAYLPVLDHVGAGVEASGFPAAATETVIFLSWKNNMVGRTQVTGTAANACPFCVGESIGTEHNALPVELGDIASIEWVKFGVLPIAKYQIAITLTAAYTTTHVIPAGSYIFSTGFANRGAKDPDYLVSDVSMVIEQVFPEPSYVSMMEKAMREDGGLVYDAHAWSNYRHAIPAGSVVSTIQMNVLQHMAKSIICIPTQNNNASLADNCVNYGDRRNGISGFSNTVQNIQWFYNEKFQPDRPVETDKISAGAWNGISAAVPAQVYNGQYIAELSKALMFFGVPNARTLLNTHGNMVYPRALALNNQVVDLTNGDFQMIANYTLTVGNMLLNCWIASIRRFKATSTGVEVIL